MDTDEGRQKGQWIAFCEIESDPLAKVDFTDNDAYAIPIDDRILAKIKLPNEDKKYLYNPDDKNIVKVEIDRFPGNTKDQVIVVN